MQEDVPVIILTVNSHKLSLQ